MLRRNIITLAAAVSLGVAALAPTTASAQRGMQGGFGMHGGGFGMHGGGFGMHSGFGMRGGFGGFRSHVFAPRFAVGNRFAFRDRFAFRHRFFPFRHRFAFAAGAPFFVGSGCLQLRHVWTDWGWTWRRVWVC